MPRLPFGPRRVRHRWLWPACACCRRKVPLHVVRRSRVWGRALVGAGYFRGGIAAADAVPPCPCCRWTGARFTRIAVAKTAKSIAFVAMVARSAQQASIKAGRPIGANLPGGVWPPCWGPGEPAGGPEGGEASGSGVPAGGPDPLTARFPPLAPSHPSPKSGAGLVAFAAALRPSAPPAPLCL